MNTALYRFAGLLALLSFASIGILEAQTAVTGAINGSVRDPANAVVTGASVEATNTATGVSDQTLTNSAGLYRFPSVLPGVYSITIKKEGFEQYTRQDINIQAGTVVPLDVMLPVGSTSATVTVSGDTPVLQTDTVEVSQTILQKQIESLPTFGNNITRLSLLAPGVSMASGQLDLHPENSGEDFNVNINGGQTNNNAHILDGVDNTEVIQGYSLLVPTNASVREGGSTSNYDAAGSASGGVFR